MKARIEKHNDDWHIITDSRRYEVVSMNARNERKLQELHDSGDQVYVQMNRTSYDPYQYQAGISRHPYDWNDDDDVVCMLRDYVDPELVDAEVERLMKQAETQPFKPFKNE